MWGQIIVSRKQRASFSFFPLSQPFSHFHPYFVTKLENYFFTQ